MLGALLIVLGCGAAGCWSLAEQQRQVRALADLERFVRLIAREMRNTQADLDQVLCRAAEGCPALFRRGGAGDRVAIERQLKALLPDEAQQLLATLFEGLGKSALLSQLQLLERCAQEARELHTAARAAHLERQKLVLTLSVLAGLLLAILLY